MLTVRGSYSVWRFGLDCLFVVQRHSSAELHLIAMKLKMKNSSHSQHNNSLNCGEFFITLTQVFFYSSVFSLKLRHRQNSAHVSVLFKKLFKTVASQQFIKWSQNIIHWICVIQGQEFTFFCDSQHYYLSSLHISLIE